MHAPFLDTLRAVTAIAVVALAGWPVATTATAAQAIGSPGGTFELTDHRGTRFASAQLAGHPYVIFFGFTHCPDICPTTLQQMSTHLKALGPDGGKLRVLFVTVDPERDTPETLHAYLSSFDPRIIGLTGSREQIAAVAKSWNAFYERLPESDGSYSIVHSGYVYLMGQDNRLAGTMAFDEPEPEQLAKISALIRNKAN